MARTFVCETCRRQFGRASTLKRHLVVHVDNCKPYACNQAECEASFARKQDRDQHQLRHSHVKRFSCGGTKTDGTAWGCGRAFHRKTTLNRHWHSIKGIKCLAGRDEDEDIAAPEQGQEESFVSDSETAEAEVVNLGGFTDFQQDDLRLIMDRHKKALRDEDLNTREFETIDFGHSLHPFDQGQMKLGQHLLRAAAGAGGIILRNGVRGSFLSFVKTDFIYPGEKRQQHCESRLEANTQVTSEALMDKIQLADWSISQLVYEMNSGHPP